MGRVEKLNQNSGMKEISTSINYMGNKVHGLIQSHSVQEQ